MSKVTKHQQDRNRRLNKNMPEHSEPEEWNVGARYGNKIRLYKKEYPNIDDESEKEEHGHHKPPRPHMRRAHWQYYWTGEGRTVQKHVWVEPTIVNGMKEDIPITMIDVTDKESQGYDGENHIRDYLEAKQIKFRSQYTVKSTGKRYDFCIVLHKDRLMIEFDGEQHFSPVELWGGDAAYQKQRITDSEKNKWCEKNRIPLLRIRFDQKPFIAELVDDFLDNSSQYITSHNKILSNEEYYSICK